MIGIVQPIFNTFRQHVIAGADCQSLPFVDQVKAIATFRLPRVFFLELVTFRRSGLIRCPEKILQKYM